MSKSLLRFFDEDIPAELEAVISEDLHNERNELNERTPSEDNSLFSFNSYPPTTLEASEEGKELLAPFFPVIQAAHRNELPPISLTWTRHKELNAYTCAIAAGIWYGQTLSEPKTLAAHLENLRRLQEDFERKLLP